STLRCLIAADACVNSSLGGTLSCWRCAVVSVMRLMVRNPCRLRKIAESETISNTISPSCTDGYQGVTVQLAEDAWVRAQISQVVRNGDLADGDDRRMVFNECVQRMRGGRGNCANSDPGVQLQASRPGRQSAEFLVHRLGPLRASPLPLPV